MNLTFGSNRRWALSVPVAKYWAPKSMGLSCRSWRATQIVFVAPFWWQMNHLSLYYIIISICNIRWLHCFYARRMKPLAMQTHLQEVPVSNGIQGQIVKLSLTFAICHYFAISVNLTHPSTPLFHLSFHLPLWCLSVQANDYFGAIIHWTYHQWQKNSNFHVSLPESRSRLSWEPHMQDDESESTSSFKRNHKAT